MAVLVFVFFFFETGLVSMTQAGLELGCTHSSASASTMLQMQSHAPVGGTFSPPQ